MAYKGSTKEKETKRLYFLRNKIRLQARHNELRRIKKEKGGKSKYNKEKSQKRALGKKGKYKMYKDNAKRRNINFNLSFEQFLTFWQKSCSYCGDEIETIGLDRIDSLKGYEINNIIPCCRWCNQMKLQHTKNDFINHCKKITRLTR